MAGPAPERHASVVKVRLNAFQPIFIPRLLHPGTRDRFLRSERATTVLTLPVPRVLERPGCPTCGAVMRLLWIEPDRPHRDRHTLECRSCEQEIEVIVERDQD